MVISNALAGSAVCNSCNNLSLFSCAAFNCSVPKNPPDVTPGKKAPPPTN